MQLQCTLCLPGELAFITEPFSTSNKLLEHCRLKGAYVRIQILQGLCGMLNGFSRNLKDIKEVAQSPA